MLQFWFDELTMAQPTTRDGMVREREKERKKERDEKNQGEKEKQRQSVTSPLVMTDSRDIVKMGEAHGYGERTRKETGGRKEEKKRENGEWRWQRSGREKCDLLGFFEMNGRNEIRN